jgi:flagellar protein FlaG
MAIEQLGAGNRSAIAAAKPTEAAGLGPTGTSEDARNREGGHAPTSTEALTAQKIAQPVASTLEFSIDPDSGRAVVKIFDNATRELVRQIPMEEMLALAKSLDQLKGLLLHAKA